MDLSNLAYHIRKLRHTFDIYLEFESKQNRRSTIHSYTWSVDSYCNKRATKIKRIKQLFTMLLWRLDHVQIDLLFRLHNAKHCVGCVDLDNVLSLNQLLAII